MATIENKEFSDQNERLNQNDKTNKKLADLDQRVNDLIDFEEQKVHKEVLTTVNQIQDTKDQQEAESLLDTLQDNNVENDSKKNITAPQQSNPLNIQKAIEERIGNENPLANQGRVESYMKVSDFATTVGQQGGIFGRLVSWLS